MAPSSLSMRDINVLEKMKDPEANPALGVIADSSLPKDPHITDQSLYERVSQKEREVILSMKELETELAKIQTPQTSDYIEPYKACISRLGELIAEHPNYASARNNRAQAIRRLYGDNMLVSNAPALPQALVVEASSKERTDAAETALGDLDKAIQLLSPRSPFAPMSPTAKNTLSLAYTQRAAIYHSTSKYIASSSSQVEAQRREAKWTSLQFEEAASRDFASGGRFGNEIAKSLAVSTNPTAKLCGQMVQEMMRKEYGSVQS
ncbi:uncharacterized protein E0L32_010447 [Thyridium curvatum]|uniref:Uncharacterized protein n=1 Tax=Thyridium curvatum TaxID=1093900 RepID=A0A507AGF0_9PEZI|nr:uncharacterized protein E0L32_010447 [Thyridium curvatum]TPX07872.1 hypothetical protein E0L32_010447 [Thyridium curvatum]